VFLTTKIHPPAQPPLKVSDLKIGDLAILHEGPHAGVVAIRVYDRLLILDPSLKAYLVCPGDTTAQNWTCRRFDKGEKVLLTIKSEKVTPVPPVTNNTTTAAKVSSLEIDWDKLKSLLNKPLFPDSLSF